MKIQIEIEPITFGELAEKWYNCEIIDYAYQYSKEIKSSINHLNCAFKNTQVTEIKFEDVKEFIARRYKYNPNTGRIMSKSLISNIIDIGSRIFEFGIDNDYASLNCSSYSIFSFKNLFSFNLISLHFIPFGQRNVIYFLCGVHVIE